MAPGLIDRTNINHDNTLEQYESSTRKSRMPTKLQLTRFVRSDAMTITISCGTRLKSRDIS